MSRNPREISAGGVMVCLLVLLSAIVLRNGLTEDAQWYTLLPVTIVLLLASFFVSPGKGGHMGLSHKIMNMKTNELNPVVITREDYDLLRPLVGKVAEEQDEMSLGHELGRAIIVNKDALPPFTVGLNSKVTVMNIETERIVEFTIVMPEYADIARHKVSILSPMGTAVIGFRKGEEVYWQVPAGLKRFRILDVVNGL